MNSLTEIEKIELGTYAIEQLTSKGLLNSPDFWKENLTENVQNWGVFTLYVSLMEYMMSGIGQPMSVDAKKATSMSLDELGNLKLKKLVEYGLMHVEENYEGRMKEPAEGWLVLTLSRRLTDIMDKLLTDPDFKVAPIVKEEDDSNAGYTEFEATAYDLSFESCGKNKMHPQYGITASGISLKGKSREEAMCVAVDKKVIPLHSKVEVKFLNKDMSKYDGIYTACDTGGAIKGNKIDIYLGEEVPNETKIFGRRKCLVKVLGK